MGCATCGGSKRTVVPGGTAATPILIGDVDGRPAQVATFRVDYEGTRAGAYRYVAGSGVEQAIEDGIIVLGWAPSSATTPTAAPAPEPPPEWYVRIGKNRWVGFHSSSEAERYATATGGTVVSRDEVLGGS